MADNNKIKVDELNFDGIKTNLRDFLRGQTQFKDYDFTGSNLSVLIDLLAYNTYYNGIYNNMTFNEMFLDSATKRNSVVSISKMLGYTPKSSRAAKARVNVTVSIPNNDANVGLDQLIIPRYTEFTSSTEDATYYFITITDRVANKNALGQYVFGNIDLYEGRVASEQYVVEPNTKYIISNQNCDTTTLRVYVNDSVGTGDPIVFNLADGIININGDSEVYWLKEIEDGMYEISFGNGVIGKRLLNGNLVTLEYIITNGSEANGCKVFKSDFTAFAPNSRISISTVSAAMNGDEQETAESIKFNAPRAYFTQNRAVTEADYQNIIYQNFSNAKSISVWGGEKNDPPRYGSVFICVEPKDSLFLTDDEKSTIINSIVKPKSILAVQPIIVDPIYINIDINTTVYYNPKSTTNSASTIADLVSATIQKYNRTDLEKFNGIFRHSKLSRLIDTTEKSILSNITTLKLRREVEPKFNVVAQYIVNIGNPIYTEGVPEESLSSTGFYIADSNAMYYLRDDGIGNVVLYTLESGKEVVVNPTLGTINYTKGIITINGLNISSIVGDALEFIIKTQSYDVVPLRNQIIKIPSTTMTINVVQDSGSASSFVFTSSRT